MPRATVENLCRTKCQAGPIAECSCARTEFRVRPVRVAYAGGGDLFSWRSVEGPFSTCGLGSDAGRILWSLDASCSRVLLLLFPRWRPCNLCKEADAPVPVQTLSVAATVAASAAGESDRRRSWPGLSGVVASWAARRGIVVPSG